MPIVNRLLCSLFLLILSGCSEKDASDGQSPNDSLELKVATVSAPKTPWYEMWTTFEQGVHQASNNKMRVKSYLLGQLGSEETNVANLRRNRIQMTGLSLQGASTVVPEIAVLTAPYLYDSYEEVNFIMDNYLEEHFRRLFAERGIEFLRWAEVGWTNIYGTKPFLVPEDARGVKLRSSSSSASQLFIQSIGANVVSLSFGELVPSLQTGLIKGGSSGLIFYALTGVGREAPHMTLTRHEFDTGLFVANKPWYDRLSDEQRQIIQKSLVTSQNARQMVQVLAKKIHQQPEEYGIKLYELTQQQRELWKQASKDNTKRLIEKLGGKSQFIYDQIIAGKKAFAAQKKP